MRNYYPYVDSAHSRELFSGCSLRYFSLSVDKNFLLIYNNGMKILIASDLHGSAEYCRQLIEAFKRENADKLLLLGDILYR